MNNEYKNKIKNIKFKLILINNMKKLFIIPILQFQKVINNPLLPKFSCLKNFPIIFERESVIPPKIFDNNEKTLFVIPIPKYLGIYDLKVLLKKAELNFYLIIKLLLYILNLYKKN